MIINPSPYDKEASRISALMRYRDIDYSDEAEFKTITELAADICNVPTALVSFVDTSDVKLRFICGLEGVSGVLRDISFFHHTIMGTEPLVIEDTIQDPRFDGSPLVINDPKFRFYAGIAILTSDNYAIGALCVLDYKPNNLNSFQIKSLQKLSLIVGKLLESKRLEIEKQKQNSHSRLFFNNAPVCIHGIDLQGCFTSMNPSGLKMLDLESEDQIKGTPYLAGVAEKDYRRIKQLQEKARQGEKSTFEFTGTSGKIYSSSFVPIKNEQDEVIRLMGISEEITVRRQAEKKLKKEMERLELVMHATNDSVWDMDKVTNKVWWNETYTNNFGRPPEGNTWEWWLERIHPNDRERVQSSLTIISESNSDRWDEKHQFKKPDGSYCYVDDHAYIARDKKGKATRILGAMRDITEQKRAEQNTRELNIALSHSLPGIARMDPDGCYDYVNKNYAGLLGYTPNELIGQSWKVTVDPEHIEAGERGFQQMLEEDNVELDIKGIRKDGSPIFKHVLIVRRVDDDGDFIGHHCFMKDITDRVEQEKKHKQLQDELAHVSRLSNMDEMATGLAHELNQPLSAISHYIDAAQTLLTKEPNINNKLLDIMQSASEQVLRSGEIVRHCRQFASNQPMEKCAVDLNDLTQETVRFLNSDAQDHNISIHVTLDNELPSIEVDKVQIQQVLVNLIRNGIEAMQNNNGKARTLTVYTHLNGKNRNEPEAQVTVKDTGPGLEISHINNLFKPFYTTKSTGMGMGLSISRSIIDAHGGKLWLDSRHTQETQFHFTLPIDKR